MIPVTVTFHGMRPRPSIEADILKRVQKLESCSRGIMSCHVVVDVPHRRHESGNRFGLRIDVKRRRGPVAVNHSASLHAAEKDMADETWSKRLDVDATQRDVRLVVREAFDVARRRLLEDIRRRRLTARRRRYRRAKLPTNSGT